MNALNLSTGSYILYQILPIQRKLEFLSDIFRRSDSKQVSAEYFKDHFKDILEDNKLAAIEIVTFLTSDGDKLNVFTDTDCIHVNCDKLAPINNLVKLLLLQGNILYRDKKIKKTDRNRHRFFMKYYRVYRKVNPAHELYPICQS